jgi:hypothetical protein
VTTPLGTDAFFQDKILKKSHIKIYMAFRKFNVNVLRRL